MNEHAVKIVLIIACVLLSVVTMMVACTIHRDNIPENRMAYCLDHGKNYVWDLKTNGVSCSSN